jgi:heptose-I-phosphate ethanolaminephosphotransferase
MKISAKTIGYLTRIFKAEWPNLVLLAFLLSPIIIRLITNHRYSKVDLLALYTTAISVLWLLAIRFVSLNQFKIHIALLPFYLLATIDLFLVLNFNSRLTAAYIFIGMNSYKEAEDFLLTYWRPITVALTIFVTCYGTGLAGLYKRELYKNKGVFVLAISALFLGYGAYFYKTVQFNSFGKPAVLDLIAKDQSTPVGY